MALRSQALRNSRRWEHPPSQTLLAPGWDGGSHSREGYNCAPAPTSAGAQQTCGQSARWRRRQ